MRESLITPSIALMIPIVTVLLSTPSFAQTTHQFTATTYSNTFSFAHPPALRISPGDRVVTKTIDAGGRDEPLTLTLSPTFCRLTFLKKERFLGKTMGRGDCNGQTGRC